MCGFNRLTAFVGLVVLMCSWGGPGVAQQPHQSGKNKDGAVLISPHVASLVEPILNLQEASIAECGAPGQPSACTDGESYYRERQRKRQLNGLLYKLTKRPGIAADEALVVLMCFYVGESREEMDAIVHRGKRMKVYLQKYASVIVAFKDHVYPNAMMKSPSEKKEDFSAVLETLSSHPEK